MISESTGLRFPAPATEIKSRYGYYCGMEAFSTFTKKSKNAGTHRTKLTVSALHRRLKKAISSVLLLFIMASLLSPHNCVATGAGGYIESRETLLNDFSGGRTSSSWRIRPSWKSRFKNITLQTGVAFSYDRGTGAVEKDFLERFDVERFFATAACGKSDVQIGKMAVNWGSGIAFNPTDVFNLPEPTNFWREYPGNYVLKLHMPAGSWNSDEKGHTARYLTFVTGTESHELRNPVTAARYKIVSGTTDLIFLFGRDEKREDRFIGFDLKGENEIGYWFEGIYRNPQNSMLESFYQILAGADYTFRGQHQPHACFELYFDSSGEKEPSRYDFTSLLAGKRRTLARTYASCRLRYRLTDEKNCSLAYLKNLNDDSAIITPSLTWNIGGRVDIMVGDNIFTGKEVSEFRPGMKRLPSSAPFLWTRFYF